MSSQYDVVVAGAGPAGCAATLVLQEAGLRVCLVDRPDDDPWRTGESLPGAALRLLRRLGIMDLNELLSPGDYCSCPANASRWGSDNWTYQDGLLNPEGGGWHLNRAAFNKALLCRVLDAGIPLYPTHISRIEKDSSDNPPRYLVHITEKGQENRITTGWLVDATGRRAWLARQESLRRQRLDDQVSAVAWIKAHKDDRDFSTRIQSVREGWWYTALLPGGVRVISLQSSPAYIASVMKDRNLFFNGFDQTAMISYRIAQQPCLYLRSADSGVAHTIDTAREGLVCVGDAALSLDPLSSQGMFFALYSGIKGAEAITQNKNGNKGALEEYTTLVSRVLETHQQSRRYFYWSEPRFAADAYWQQRRQEAAFKTPAGAFA